MPPVIRQPDRSSAVPLTPHDLHKLLPQRLIDRRGVDPLKIASRGSGGSSGGSAGGSITIIGGVTLSEQQPAAPGGQREDRGRQIG